tara:strand:+ start:28 stop:657 length:630 start_codon:yes stop_codon:yes gene_type:complete
MSNPLVLFGVPIYSYDKYIGSSIHDTSAELKDCLENEGRNFISKNTCVLDLRNYKSIRERILEGLKEYTSNILCIADSVKFYLTQSWLNINPPGTHHHRHIHPNALISGVYYIDVEESASITFASSNATSRYGNTSFSLPLQKYNIWNSLVWRQAVRTNEIIYFPSSLEHSVDENESNKERISLAFNVFFTGTIGEPQGLNVATIGNYI